VGTPSSVIAEHRLIVLRTLTLPLYTTIEKHRQSGHYGDPEYAFEEWITNVLPNIRPGFVYTWPNGIKGLHMFTGYQIWPCVRNWSVEEWVDIPETMRKYFGSPQEGVEKTTSTMFRTVQEFQVYK
jgi:hypothetical protein